MPYAARPLRVAVLALAVMGAMSAGASAHDWRIVVPGGGPEVVLTSTEAVALQTTAGSSTCSARFEAQLTEAPFPQGVRTEIGFFGESTFSGCSGTLGSVQLLGLGELNFEGPQGTLPSPLAGIDLTAGAFVRTSANGIECRYFGNLGLRASADYVAGTTNPFAYVNDEMSIVPSTLQFQSGSFACSRTLRVTRGTFAVAPEPTWEWSVAGPILTLPSEISFGSIGSGGLAQRSLEFAVSAATSVSSIAMGGGGAFAVSDPNRCRGASLPAGGTCTFTVIFAPPRAASFADEVIIETDRGTIVVPVTGSA